MKFQELNVIQPEIRLFCSIKKKAPFDPKFFQMMINRLLVGSYRHGKNTKEQNYLTRLYAAVDHYVVSGNQEFLVDAANYALLECLHPSHPASHFKSSDSHGRTERWD